MWMSNKTKVNVKLSLLIAGILFLLINNSCEKNDDLTEIQNLSFNHNGVEREYIFYRPNNLPANAPLVFVLHGFTMTAQFMLDYTDINDLAGDNGFAVCYPQGTLSDGGVTHWNANLTISNADDVGFLKELAIYLQAEYNLNPQRTFSCGFSNGGFMSYTLACEAPNVFRAIASVAGTMSRNTWNNCNPSEPIPVLQISGVNDELVPIDGSMSSVGGWGGAPPMDTIIYYWANLNSCTTIDTVFIPSSTTAFYHRNGINDNEVWYYKIDNWGHEWPASGNESGTNASEVIWEFFSRF